MSYTSSFSLSGGRDRGREEGSEGGAFLGKRRNFLISAVRRGERQTVKRFHMSQEGAGLRGRSCSRLDKTTQQHHTTRGHGLEKYRAGRKSGQLSQVAGQKFLEVETRKWTRRSGILTRLPSAGPSSLTSSLARSPGRPAFTYPLRPLSPARLQTALTCSPRRRRTKTKGPRKQREEKK